MGLFNFGKKNKLPTSNEFYTTCVTEFHKEALNYGLAKKGLILIPELMPLGQKTIMAFLTDEEINETYSGDLVQLYFAVMSFTLEAGMLFAEKWHSNFAFLSSYAEMIAVEGPAVEASFLFGEHFSDELADDDGHAFCERIFEKWVHMHEPYWDLSDPREYTFKAFMAVYQLGVSMMLEKLGY